MSVLLIRQKIIRMDGAGGGSRRGKPKDSDGSSDDDDTDSGSTILSNITLNISKRGTSLPTSARTTPGTSRCASSTNSGASCGYKTPGSKCSSTSMISRHSAPARSEQIQPERNGRRTGLPESIYNTSVGILGAIAKIPKRLAFPDDVESNSSELLLEPMTAPSSWASTTSKGQCHCLKKYENAFPNYKLVCRCNFKKLNPSEEKLMKVTEAESSYSVKRIRCPHSTESRRALGQEAATVKECPPDKNMQGKKDSCCDVMKKRIKGDEETKQKENVPSHSVPKRKEVTWPDSGKEAPTLTPKLAPEKMKPTLEPADKDRGKPTDYEPQQGTSRQGLEPKVTPKTSFPESKQPQPSTKIPEAKKDSRDNFKITKSPSVGTIAKKPIDIVNPPVHSGVVKVSSKSSWQQISKLEVITEEQAEVDKAAEKPAVVVRMPPKSEQEKPKQPAPAIRGSPRSIKPAPDTISTKSVPSTSSFGQGSKTPSRKGSQVFEKDTPSRKSSVTSTSIKTGKEPTKEKPTTAIPVRKGVSFEHLKEEKKPELPDQPSKQSTKIPDKVSSVREKDSTPSRKSSTSSIPTVDRKPVDKTTPGTDGKATPGPSYETKITSPRQEPAKDLLHPAQDHKKSPTPSKKEVEPKKIHEDTSRKPVEEVYKPALPHPSSKDDAPKDAKPHYEELRETPERKKPDTKPEVKLEKLTPAVTDKIEPKDRADAKYKTQTTHEYKNKAKEDAVEDVPATVRVVEKSHPKQDLPRKEEPPHKQDVYEKPQVEPSIDKREPKVEHPIEKKEPKVETPIEKKEPKVEPPIEKKEPKVEPHIEKTEPKVEPPIEKKEPKVEPHIEKKEQKVEHPLEKEGPKDEPRIEEKEPSTKREEEHKPAESASDEKRPKEKLWGKTKYPSKQEIKEKPKTESPVTKKEPKEPIQSKEKPSTQREDESGPQESPSQLKRSLWGKAKSASKEVIAEKPKVEIPKEEKLHKDKSKDKTKVEIPKEEKLQKDKSKEKPTQREDEHRPKESPSELKRLRWGKAKSPSKEEATEKPKVEIPKEEKPHRDKSKEKPTQREDEHRPKESPSQVKRPLWGKAKSSSKDLITEKPKVEIPKEEKVHKDKSKEKPTQQEDEHRPKESPSQVKRPLWGKAKSSSKELVTEKPKVESPLEKKQSKKNLWGKEKLAKEKDPDKERSVEPVSDRRKHKSIRWKKSSILWYEPEKMKDGAATSKTQQVSQDDFVTIYSNVSLMKAQTAKESHWNWKHAVCGHESSLFQEIKEMLRGEHEDNKLFTESHHVRKSFITPLMSHIRLGEARSSGIRRDESSSSKFKSSESKDKPSKHHTRRRSEGKSGLWGDIIRVTPIRKHSTDKSEDKKDKRDKKIKTDKRSSEDKEDKDDSQSKQKDSHRSKDSKDRFSKKALGKRDSEDHSVSSFWKSIGRITPITRSGHRRDSSRPTSSRRLIDDSNIFVAERLAPSHPMYLKSKQSHHSMLKSRAGYWIDEKGLYREIVEMAHHDDTDDHHPIAVRSSRWFRKSEQELPGPSKESKR